ncbi:response regulator [Sphingomonas sp.]|jgi:PAS domain S-box-containing protein|uniref:response regulator n=1 Tax=Sphingomonas sp. TaxID=28214 RepID=UPI002ED8F919
MPITSTSADILDGPGEVRTMMRAHDWSASPLGPPESWPQSLKTVVRIMLSSRYAMWMLWGPELTFLCNDAYRPTLGVKRNWLGARSDKVWEEIWHDIGPRIERVFETGEATWDEGLLLFLERSGFREETYHTFSYSPLADDDGAIVGMLCVVTEVTERVIGERRLRVLRDLGLRTAEARTVDALWTAVRGCLAADPCDLPLTLTYLREGDAHVLAAATGIEAGHAAAPERDPEAVWSLEAGAMLIDDLPLRFDTLPAGPWELPPAQALIVPIPAQGQEEPVGMFIAGLNPYRPLDAEYRGFIDLFVGQIAAGLASATANEAERRRAEALAEIDRAKTNFFSNVSHEFRTPLTLMIGPLEDALGDAAPLSAEQRERIDIAHRNSLRLLRLVNGLLEFSRMEAGRVQASFRVTDVAMLTADLASSFRAATDRAGLTLEVDCPPLAEAPYVDRDVWETIVLNLLSNAFKFTFTGGIAVVVRADAGAVRLEVRDTGTGIPADELPRLFERFHRVEGAQGRSFEGSGIGLALVQELVKQHGGDMAVDSVVGAGTRFVVTIPLGAAHLPADRLARDDEDLVATERARAFVEEALRWLPADGAPATLDAVSTESPGAGARIVLADDNADLRDYVARLLRHHGYVVETVGDGIDALAAIRRSRPDLVMSDVMMPRLDGLGLLHAIRRETALRGLPVILLSARAGEDAKVEGLEAGADDYLAKPFSARELVARVSTNLELARVRREMMDALAESEARFRNMADHAPVMMWVTEADGQCTYLNRAWYEFTGQSEAEALGLGWIDATHPDDKDRAERVFLDANADEAPFRLEYRLRRTDGAYRWAIDAASPRYGSDGAFLGYIGSVIDITDRKSNEDLLALRVAEEMAAREEAEEALRQAQKMEAVGQLTGGIAHDFNNLLTIITGNIDIARRSLGSDATSRAGRAMDNAQKGADRAAALTQRLLAFSRRQPLAPKPLDVDKLVGGMADLLHRALGELVQLEIVTNPGLWRVEADANQLENAILNLAVNARDAMVEGGTLTIETANARLDEHYGAAHAEVAPGNYTVIAVTDTGVGMTRETLARVFEPFFTTKEVGKGTGLGLSQVYGFVKQSGGHVKVYSEPGDGTTVKLYLPRLMSEADTDDQPHHDGADRSARGQTILVVEDDEDVRAYTVEILRELGYSIIQAHDGPSALVTIERESGAIDLLFTDVVMPGMSGRELADHARALRPALKVLYTSGYTRNAIVHGGRLDKGVEMIAKPFTFKALAEKIADVLAAGSSGRLIVVEDDPNVRMFAVEALVGAGYAVDEAATGSEALNRIRASRGRYDAVVLDIRLPDGRGTSLAAELRALHADLPILIATGEHETDARVRFANDRCVSVIGKPYNAAMLTSALETLGVRCAGKARGAG